MIPLSFYNDEELLRHARNEQDRLVTTEFETEFAKRFALLIDTAAEAPSEDLLADHCGWADEALAQFPEEDFLQEAIDELAYLETQMQRSQFKGDVASAKEKLIEIQSTVSRAAEYAREQLKNITG